jgi:hypothetical protein
VEGTRRIELVSDATSGGKHPVEASRVPLTRSIVFSDDLQVQQALGEASDQGPT